MFPKSNADRSRKGHGAERQSSKTLFCRLTPELSRPVTGRRTRASVAHRTWPTPRHGVGLNELLGGKDADEVEAVADLPKAEARMPERAPANLQPDLTEAAASGADEPAVSQSTLPKPASATHAKCERA
jgi:hypothetical protein